MKNLHDCGLTSSTSCKFAIDVHEVGKVLCLLGLGRVGTLLRRVQHQKFH